MTTLNPQIFGAAATPANERLTIDDIIARDRDPRTPQERARDDARKTVAAALNGARAHLEWVRMNTPGSSRARVVAEQQLARAEQAARAAGVPL